MTHRQHDTVGWVQRLASVMVSRESPIGRTQHGLCGTVGGRKSQSAWTFHLPPCPISMLDVRQLRGSADGRNKSERWRLAKDVAISTLRLGDGGSALPPFAGALTFSSIYCLVCGIYVSSESTIEGMCGRRPCSRAAATRALFDSDFRPRPLGSAMAKYQHATSKEAAFMKKMHGQGMGLRKMRAITGHSFDTTSKHLFKKNNARKVNPKGGRRPSLRPCSSDCGPHTRR